jgi:hypothetical protein
VVADHDGGIMTGRAPERDARAAALGVVGTGRGHVYAIAAIDFDLSACRASQVPAIRLEHGKRPVPYVHRDYSVSLGGDDDYRARWERTYYLGLWIHRAPPPTGAQVPMPHG